MTRVLFVGQSYIAGDGRQKLERLAQTPGLEIFLIAPTAWRNSALGQYAFQPLPPERGVRAYPLPIHNNGRVFLFFYAPRAVRQLVRQLRPDILHIEQEPGSLALLEFILLAHRPGRTRLLAFTWENIAQRRSWPRRWLERWQLRQLDHLFTGNREAAEVFRAKGYRGPLTVLPNVGVSPEHFAPRPDPAFRRQLGLTGEFVVGYAGRLAPEKGLPDLLRAFQRLPAAAQLFILGSGPERAALAQQAQALGLSDRVIFHPAVPHADMPRYLNCLDVLALPSRSTRFWKEQFGLVLAQAMACGVPAVGSDSGAIPEVLDEAGLIFPEGDAAALASHLQRLLADPVERQARGRRGRQRVLEHYTHAVIAERTLEVYRTLAPIGPESA